MKFRFNPIFAAICVTGCIGAAHAAATTPQPEMRTEVRTIIVDSGTTLDSAHMAGEIVIAQSEPGAHKREVKVITSGPHFNMPDPPDVNMLISNAMSEAFSGSMNMSVARNVKNAPYSAEVISEKVQTLPDGNQISRKSSSMSYRDSAGRTRQETLDSKGEVRSVHIHDAVDGTRYVLSPAQKSASKISIDKDLQKRIEEIKEKARAMAKDGKVVITERSHPGEEITVKRIESAAGDGRQEVREEVKVNVVRMSGATAPVGADGGQRAYSFTGGESIGHAIGESMRHGPIGMSFQDMKWSGKSITTQLGTKDFDGVRADGKSVSYTIPAGEIGNRNPIVVSTETWTSPDLQVVVYSRHSDPRVGDSIYRLANVKRTEQPSTLFMVPDGYSVKVTPNLGISTKQK